MGLMTRSKTPAAYTHGNSLCENTVNRVRGLAGTLMNHVETKLSMKLKHQSWFVELGIEACKLVA